MFIELFKNNGIDYLRLVENKRVTNAQGKKTISKKVILNIGSVSRFDDGEEDYIGRLRKSFRDGTPLIPELLPYVDSDPAKKKEKYEITYIEGDGLCFGNPKWFAPCILDPAFAALGLDTLFASIKHADKIEYDLQGIVRLLVYGRILEPASKIATMRQNSKYYTPLVKSGNDDNVYDVLDVIWANRKKIIQRMNTCISSGIGRNTDTVFYDVTNFFFETERPDDDMVDEEGNVVEKGLRKMGVSKENRKQPIVQMGLFLDDNGIPISIEMFPGNTLDHLTLRDAMRNTVNMLKLNRFILVADRGMYSGTNMCHVLNQGDGYIVSKSLKKSTKNDREWTLKQEDYIQVSPDFKYKSRIVKRSVTDEDGSKRHIQEKVVVYWSQAYYKRELHENKSFIDFVEKLKKNPNGFRVTAAQSRSLRKFLKKELMDKKTGEILDGNQLVAMIDEEKLSEFNDIMGYYQIVSSELDMPDLEIIDKYHGLTRIEDQFREMKGTLETRPIFVRTPEHIQAHLMICFMALTIIRVIQYKIGNSLADSTFEKKNWSYALPGRRLSEALLNWQVNQLSDIYFQFLNVSQPDLSVLLSAFNLSIPKRLFTPGDLRSLKSSVKIF